jgi:hypothetical protein
VLYERKDGRTGLGLVSELQGKKNAFVLDGQVSGSICFYKLTYLHSFHRHMAQVGMHMRTCL